MASASKPKGKAGDKKKLLLWGGLGLAGVVVVVIALKNQQGQSAAPLAQYAAAVLPGGGGSTGWSGSSTPVDTNAPPPPSVTGNPPPLPRPAPGTQPGLIGGHPGPDLAPPINPGGRNPPGTIIYDPGGIPVGLLSGWTPWTPPPTPDPNAPPRPISLNNLAPVMAVPFGVGAPTLTGQVMNSRFKSSVVGRGQPPIRSSF